MTVEIFNERDLVVELDYQGGLQIKDDRRDVWLGLDPDVTKSVAKAVNEFDYDGDGND